ncbi:DEKNAAC100377 [Brettanomyces naardenensis]|uniref:Restriction of telomere capping protein 4 n=1 Tax=Brettanomyces naardenensis TaxID=13370 RepID=A0A448YEC5_BRENA|nr:DEKNAAC100377 [Brettanomyces naardenensis]
MSFQNKQTFSSLKRRPRKGKHRVELSLSNPKRVRSLNSRPISAGTLVQSSLKVSRHVGSGKHISLDSLSFQDTAIKPSRRRKPKASVYIADLKTLAKERNSLQKDVLIEKNEVEEFLSSVEKDKSKPWVDDFTYGPKVTEILSGNFDDEGAVDNGGEEPDDTEDPEETKKAFKVAKEHLESLNLYDDTRKVAKVRKKYEAQRPDFHPVALEKAALQSRVRPLLPVVLKIIKNKIPSHFYDLAKEYCDSTPMRFISDIQLINVLKSPYYGYYGVVRSHVISKYIVKKFEKELKRAAHHDEVVRFWGVEYFALYVLASEVIARFVKEDLKLGSLDDAYGDMIQTNDYGLYIMDKIAVEKDEDIWLDSDDGEGGGNKRNKNDEMQKKRDNETRSTPSQVGSDDELDIDKLLGKGADRKRTP